MPKRAIAACGTWPEVKTANAVPAPLAASARPSRSTTRRAIAGAGSTKSPATAPAAASGRAAADSVCRQARQYRCVRRHRRKQGAISACRSPRRSTGVPASSASAYVGELFEPTSVTGSPGRKSRMSARVYSRATVASVPSTETRRVSEPAQAGLIAGTVPTNGTAKTSCAASGSTMVEAVLQAMTTRSGRFRRNQRAHEVDDAANQRRFRSCAP